jgi:cytochrome P450
MTGPRFGFPPAYSQQRLGGAVFNWRNFRALQRDILGLSREAAAACGDVVRLRFGHKWATMVHHPEGVQHVLKDNCRNYDKATPGFQSAKTYLGEGLITHVGGEQWRAHRRAVQPAFKRARTDRLAVLCGRRAVETVQRLSLAGRDGVVDLTPEVDRLTIGIVGEALFSTELTPVAADIEHALTVAFAHAKGNMYNPVSAPNWVPTRGNRALWEAQRILQRVVSEILQRAARSAGQPPDLLDLLRVAAVHEESDEARRRWIRDELVTMIQGGYETTSNAIVWTLVNLSEQPAIRRQLQDELRVLGGRPPTLDDLGRLPYLGQVVQEAMRIDPPGWGVDRRAIDEDVVGGFRVPKDSLIYLAPYLTHRHPEFWARPGEFDPEHFTPGAVAARHPMAYLPFGAGQRACIGSHFAMLELKVVVAMLCQHFDLDVLAPVPREASITLRPAAPVMTRVTPR